VPRVPLNDPAPPPDRCSVTTDNVHGGYLAARHLIEMGRRRLLFAGQVADGRRVAEELLHRRAAAALLLEEIEDPASHEHRSGCCGRSSSRGRARSAARCSDHGRW
jgi:LacI family transcriptional regulator